MKKIGQVSHTAMVFAEKEQQKRREREMKERFARSRLQSLGESLPLLFNPIRRLGKTVSLSDLVTDASDTMEMTQLFLSAKHLVSSRKRLEEYNRGRINRV